MRRAHSFRIIQTRNKPTKNKPTNTFEDHPRIALRWQLGRILVLNILNFVCLLLSTFEKVHSQTKQLKEIKENLTILYTMELEENKTLDLSNFVTQSIISAVTLTAVVREKRSFGGGAQSEGEGRLYPPHSAGAHEHDATTSDPTQFLQTTYYEEQLEGRLIKPKVVDRSNFFENFSIYNNHTEKPIDALFTPAKLNVTTPPPAPPTPMPSRPTEPRQPPTRKRPRPTTTTTSTAKPRPNVTRLPPKIAETPDETAENATELVTLIYQLDENTTALIDANNFTEDTTKKRKWPITTTPPPNCTQDEEVAIDPFKLFEFAQKLEREGFQNYTTILKGLWWVYLIIIDY